MKNQIWITIFVLALYSAACSKSDPAPVANDCAAIVKKFGDAAALYITSPTTANCKAYVAAANEYLNKASACGVSAADITSARNSLNGTTCP
jgi:hypothetical protein